MTAKRVTIVLTALAGMITGAVFLFDFPLEKALLLAPVIVATVGATVLVFVLWAKIAYEGLRAHRHPLRIVAAGVAGFAVLVMLSFFIDLPRTH